MYSSKEDGLWLLVHASEGSGLMQDGHAGLGQLAAVFPNAAMHSTETSHTGAR